MDDAVIQFNYNKCLLDASAKEKAANPCKSSMNEDGIYEQKCLSDISPNASTLAKVYQSDVAACKAQLDADTKASAISVKQSGAGKSEKFDAQAAGDESAPPAKPASKTKAKPLGRPDPVSDTGDDDSNPSPSPAPAKKTRPKTNAQVDDQANDNNPQPARKKQNGDDSAPDGTDGKNPDNQKADNGKDKNPDNSKPDSGKDKSDSADSNGGDNTADAQATAQSDIASCNQAQSNASRCCQNPMSCAGNMSIGKSNLTALNQEMSSGPADGQSINDYCAQMDAAGANSGVVNTGLAAVCSTRTSSCSSICDSLAQKYQNLMSSCGDNCKNSSIYQNAYQSLTNQSSSCAALDSLGQELAAQGNSNTQGTTYSALCQNQSSAQASNASPSSNAMGSGQPSNSMGSLAPVASSGGGCQSAANSDACVSGSGTQSASPLQSASTMGFQQAQLNSGHVNVGDLADQTRRAYGFDPQTLDGAGSAKPLGASSGVPQNGGGGGGLFAGVGSPSLQAGARTGMMATGGPQIGKTDIMHGTRSGGATSSPGNSLISTTNSSAEKAATRAVASIGNGFTPFSLKEYLPGFMRDPRRMGGLQNADILGKGEDIFQHISNKMVERCRLEKLYRCEN